jgi:hypothetical protein
LALAPEPTQPQKERNVSKSIGASVCAFALIFAGGVVAQGMLLDFAADKVVKKYQEATCEQLKAQRDEPRTEREKMAIEFLRNDSQARVAFIDKIAAPVLNKMFECGLIP